jgi:hypothetical protein
MYIHIYIFIQLCIYIKELMLAQAQLCFYEKAVKDQKAGHMKPGTIACIYIFMYIYTYLCIYIHLYMYI